MKSRELLSVSWPFPEFWSEPVVIDSVVEEVWAFLSSDWPDSGLLAGVVSESVAVPVPNLSMSRSVEL